MDVLARVIPFFLMIGVGIVASRARLISMDGAKALSTYVFWIAFPALLVHSLAAMPRPEAALARSLAAYAVSAAAPLFVALLVGRMLRWPREQRAGAGMASIGGNTAFLGAPLAVSLFGVEAAVPAAAVVAVDCTVIMAIATFTLRGAAGEGWKKTLATTAGNPLVIAALVGLGLCLTGYDPVRPVNDALGMLRATASPVGLVALGAVIGLEFARPANADAAATATSVAFKLVLAPALVWLATGIAGAEPLFRATATLLAACPTAVNVFIQTRAYGVFARGGAMAVVLASLVAAVSLPLIGAGLARWLG
jgi:predicted permease